MFFKAICIILQEYQVALLQGYIEQIKDILKETFNSEKEIIYNKAVNQIVPMCIWKLNENESFVQMNQNIVSLSCNNTEERLEIIGITSCPKFYFYLLERFSSLKSLGPHIKYTVQKANFTLPF